MHLAQGTVDDDVVARFAHRDNGLRLPYRDDAERPRDDGDVGRGAAFFEHHASELLAVVLEQFRRAHRAFTDLLKTEEIEYA